MAEIWVCRLPEMRGEQEVKDIYPFLSEERTERLQKFIHFDDRLRSAISDLLIRYAFFVDNGQALRWEQLERNPFGKPFLPDFPSFHFNVSHSGEWVVCAVHDSPVGIDVEEVKQVDVEAFKSVLTKSECEAVTQSVDPVRTFYRYWTAKESVVKADGRGLSCPLTDFGVHIHEDGSVDVTATNQSLAESFSGRLFDLDDSTMTTISAEQMGKRSVNIRRVTLDSLMSI